MLTLRIPEENDIKERLVQILAQAGYTVSADASGENVIAVTRTEGIRAAVVELEKSLYNEKKGVLYKSLLDIVEKPLIERVLARTEGNQFKAARILGINRNTMRAKIKKLGINPDTYKEIR